MTDRIDGFAEAERRAGWWGKRRDDAALKRHHDEVAVLAKAVDPFLIEAEYELLGAQLELDWDSEAGAGGTDPGLRGLLRLLRRYEIVYDIWLYQSVRASLGDKSMRVVKPPVPPVEDVLTQPNLFPLPRPRRD